MWFLNHFTTSFVTGPKWTFGIPVKKLSKGLRWTPKSSTRMCIFHCPKLDDIFQKELRHHQPRWGCWMWWLEGKLLMYGRSFMSLGSEVSIPAITPCRSLPSWLAKWCPSHSSWHSSLGYERGGRDMMPPLSSGPEEKDDWVRCMLICDWSGSGVDSEAVGSVWWPSWTDRQTDGWQTMKGSRMQSDKVDTCAWV